MKIKAGDIKGIALEAGGVRVAAYLPVIDSLIKNGANLTHFSGTSGGSIIAALLAYGYTVQDISKKIQEGLMERMNPFVGIFNAIKRNGLRDSGAIEEVMSELIFECRFEDFPGLYIYAINENTGTLELFSSETTPKLTVAKGCAASCAIPLYYTSVKIDGFDYFDGGALNPFPIAVLRDVGGLRAEQILGLKIDTSSEIVGSIFKAKSFIGRLSRMIDIMIQGNAKKHLPDDLFERTISIPDMGVSATKFKLSRDEKFLLSASGFTASKKIEWAK